VTFTGTTFTTATVSVPAATTITILHPNSSAGETGTIDGTPNDLDDGSFTINAEGSATLSVSYA
jgi:hypothetical protein